jgi:hypothetical protein
MGTDAEPSNLRVIMTGVYRMQYLTETELDHVAGGHTCFPDANGNLPPMGTGPWVIYPPTAVLTPEMLELLLNPQGI